MFRSFVSLCGWKKFNNKLERRLCLLVLSLFLFCLCNFILLNFHEFLSKFSTVVQTVKKILAKFNKEGKEINSMHSNKISRLKVMECCKIRACWVMRVIVGCVVSSQIKLITHLYINDCTRKRRACRPPTFAHHIPYKYYYKFTK